MSPEIAEYLIESPADVPLDELLGLIRFVRTLDVHIARLSHHDWPAKSISYSIKRNRMENYGGKTLFLFLQTPTEIRWFDVVSFAGLTVVVRLLGALLCFRTAAEKSSHDEKRNSFSIDPSNKASRVCVCVLECRWKPLKCRVQWKKITLRKSIAKFSIPLSPPSRLSSDFSSFVARIKESGKCVDWKNIQSCCGGERWSVTVGEIGIFFSTEGGRRRRREKMCEKGNSKRKNRHEKLNRFRHSKHISLWIRTAAAPTHTPRLLHLAALADNKFNFPSSSPLFAIFRTPLGVI